MEERYSRHLILDEIGSSGQQLLQSARVLVVGAGGLGCPALQYLCSSGIGTLRVVDGDQVALSNLPRQILYGSDDVGRLKVEVVGEKLTKLNSEVHLELIPEMLDENNISDVLHDVDVVLDCTDSYRLRYLLSDAVDGTNLPIIYAALHKFEGQLTVLNYQGGMNYRDLFPDEDKVANIPTCVEVGVYTILPGIMGLMQASEAVKIILKKPGVLGDKMLIYNTLNNNYTTYKTSRIEENIS